MLLVEEFHPLRARFSHVARADVPIEEKDIMATKRDQGALLAAAFLGTVLAIPAAMAQKPAGPLATPPRLPSVTVPPRATQSPEFQSAGDSTTLPVLNLARNS